MRVFLVLIIELVTVNGANFYFRPSCSAINAGNESHNANNASHSYNQRWAFIGENILPILVNAQNSFSLSIIDITFAIYFVIADELSRQAILFAV